ncbi:MAG TPA: hypothetical protein VGH19_08035 [Verrucomicrobiae bacterium]
MSIRHFLIFLTLVQLAALTFASDIALPSSAISSGGGNSSGGPYSLLGTIGQPATMISSNGQYRLDPGFWAVALAVQTEGAPVLSIQRTGNQVILSWSSLTDEFVLQKTTTLGASPLWQDVLTSPVSNAESRSVTLALQPWHQFFRLRKQP